MRKYKYYIHKPKSEIVKDILSTLLISGVLVLGGGTAASAIWNNALRYKKYPKKKFCDTFTRLRRRGLLSVEQDGYDLKVRLTPDGKKAAGYMQIEKLEIKRPKHWDGFWRLILFDISILKTPQRNGFRGMLKEIGFISLQKSVWLHAFDCRAETDLLKDFYGLNESEVRLIHSKDIGSDDHLRKHFRI